MDDWLHLKNGIPAPFATRITALSAERIKPDNARTEVTFGIRMVTDPRRGQLIEQGANLFRGIQPGNIAELNQGHRLAGLMEKAGT